MPTKNQTEPTQMTDEELSALMEGEEETLVEEQTGFPPYWNPGIGKWFKATVMSRDDRDPDFIRYHLLALTPVVCAKGPADDSEEIEVLPGEFFTCSAYAALPLDKYFGIDIKVVTFRKRKLDGNEASRGVKRDLFEFKIFVTPESRHLLEAGRKAEALALRKAAQDARVKMIATATAHAKSRTSSSNKQQQQEASSDAE